MYGWTGKMLHVDLSGGTCTRQDLRAELLHAYLGGRGLGVRLMRDYHTLDPFDSRIPLIFSVGPLSGSAAPSANRVTAVSRSPLTGTIFDAGGAGRFAAQLKGAGLDLIFITGRSASPVLLSIEGENARLLPAQALWGKTTRETITALKGSGSVATIGVAGEKQALMANIVLDEGDSLTRGGLGAIMGAKGLKAVTVSGDLRPAVADRARFENACNEIMSLFRASPVLLGESGLAAHGTAALVDLLAHRRMTPTRNFSASFFEDQQEYSGPLLRRAFDVRRYGCYGCPIQCKRRLPAGEVLPEYDALSHLGALNGISDTRAIVIANSLCLDLGLDVISAAATLAAVGEAQGRFPEADELNQLLTDLALRQGSGELMSLGARRAMEKLGRPELSMSVKSLELPAYDPRGSYGLALGYCTSNRGGCHLEAYPISHEVLENPVPTEGLSPSGKAAIIKAAEDENAAVDSLAVCQFAFLAASLEEYGEVLSALTGEDFSVQRLEETGERIFRTERYYNCANGFTAADDILPERFFREPGSGGAGVEVPPLDKSRLLAELQEYYRMRGLTEEGTFADAKFLEREP